MNPRDESWDAGVMGENLRVGLVEESSLTHLLDRWRPRQAGLGRGRSGKERDGGAGLSKAGGRAVEPRASA